MQAKHMKRSWLKYGMGISLVLIFAALEVSAQTSTLWQIGKADKSSFEFNAAATQHVIYHANGDAWSRVWPKEQKVGSSYEVKFTMKEEPRGTFTLKIDSLTYGPGVPALKIRINGHEGTYYLHPQVSYDLGDQRSIFDPGYAFNTLTVELPAKDFKIGENTLVLSCVSPEGDTAEQANVSSLHYDTLELTNSPQQHADEFSIDATITPTIFYFEKGGHLQERIEAVVRSAGPGPAGNAALQIGGHTYMAQMPAVQDFGETRLQFEVLEWKGAEPAHLEITGGKTASFEASLTPAKKWTLYIVPHTHVDVGYTDYQGKVAEAQARTLDEASEMIRQYPDFRFATDGSWNLEQFLSTRSPEQQKIVLDQIKEDKIGVPVQYANLLTGYASSETLYRSLYYTKHISQQYKIPFQYANTTDVPAYTGSYPSVLAGAGIKYWVAAGNNDRAPILSHEAWNAKSPFWWKGPDGKSVLFWYSRCYEQVMFLFGLPPRQEAIYESLPVFLQAYSTPEYKPDVALIYGTQPENTDLVPETASFATEWNKHHAYPKLQYSTFADFFQYIDEHHGKELPTYKGDMGPYWEDGIGADSGNAAKDRENQSRVLSAETLSSVVEQANPKVHAPEEPLREAWKNIILFSEHTWTSGNSVRQPGSEEAMGQLAIKDNYAVQARFQINDVINRGLGQLTNEIHIPAQTLVVFNSLSWKRNALIETDLNEKEELVDLTTNKVIPVEVLWRKENFVHARFLAEDLPPVGYKCFLTRTITKEPSADAVASNSIDSVIENSYYRIKVDVKTGMLQSIFDKELQRELIDTHSPYKFGQYLYVTGGDGKTRMINPFHPLPLGDLTIHSTQNAQYQGVEKTSWGYRIRFHGSALNTPSVDLELLVPNNKKEIEFHYTLQKKYVTAKEAVYFAFPVAAQSPEFSYATQQDVVDPAHDMFKGANLEWFSIQKWMAVSDEHMTVGIVPVDAPLASFGDINRGEWIGDFHPKSGTLFSYAMNNYWHTNYPAGQGGAFQFRYVLTSASHLDAAALTRLGWENMQPAEVNHVVHQDKVGNPERPLPPEGASFLSIDNSNVILTTWKDAEDGKGAVLRLQEIAGAEQNAHIKFTYGALHEASLCNAVEDDLKDLQVQDNAVNVSLQPHEVLTIKMKW